MQHAIVNVHFVFQNYLRHLLVYMVIQKITFCFATYFEHY